MPEERPRQEVEDAPLGCRVRGTVALVKRAVLDPNEPVNVDWTQAEQTLRPTPTERLRMHEGGAKGQGEAMTTKAKRLPRTSTLTRPRATLPRMATTARAHEPDDDGEVGGVVLAPEEEARLVQRLAEMDESERAGKMIPWETIRAERGM
jgi:hypothetical protein